MSRFVMALPSESTTAPTPRMGADSLSKISAAIARLGDADPAVRRRAADELVHMGATARPAVLAASRGDDPQTADAAALVLRALPWSTPDDPPDVKGLIEPYGSASVVDRISIIVQLAQLPQGQPALLRLLSAESNEDICWQIEKQLILQSDVKTFGVARQLDLQTARPAALVLAGHAWLTQLTGGRTASLIDPGRAAALLGRAVELETLAPTYDDGELDFAFDQLAGNAVIRGQYDVAAALRRQQCKRIGMTRSRFPSPFFELLVLHANYGPLAGFQDDLRAYRSYLSAPESLFIFSRLYSREGQSLMEETLVQAALAASPAHSSSEEARIDVADFLIHHGWNELATRECRATLSFAGANPDVDEINARLRLSSLAAMRGDEGQAADELRRALDENGSVKGDLSVNDGSRVLRGAQAQRAMRIEVAQHALHAAKTKGDSAEVGRQLDELMRLGPDDADAALDLVPELKAMGRGAEAAKLFQSVYRPLKAKIDAGNCDPSLMNEIAWLCARCGEHLDEALDFSNRAVAAEPNSSAYLDTSAEAHFRKGQAGEAARLEKLALKYQPRDRFMEGQLKRFEAGEKQDAKMPTTAGSQPSGR